MCREKAQHIQASSKNKRQRRTQKAQISENKLKLSTQSCFIKNCALHSDNIQRRARILFGPIYHEMFHTYVHNNTQPTCSLIKCEYNISSPCFKKTNGIFFLNKSMKIDSIQRTGTKAENKRCILKTSGWIAAKVTFDIITTTLLLHRI